MNPRCGIGVEVEAGPEAEAPESERLRFAFACLPSLNFQGALNELDACLAAVASNPSGRLAWPFSGNATVFDRRLDQRLLALKAVLAALANDPVMTVIRRPKASGQPETRLLQRDGWWETS